MEHDSAPYAETVLELVEELAPSLEPDRVEHEVAVRFPLLDEERLAAAWLLADAIRRRH